MPNLKELYPELNNYYTPYGGGITIEFLVEVSL